MKHKFNLNSLPIGMSFVTITTVICSIIHFVFSVYSRRFVSVTDFGLFTSCCLLSTYMNYLQIGVVNSFNRDYPQLIGAGKAESAKNIRNNVISLLFLIYGISIVLIEIVLLILKTNGSISNNTYGGLAIIAPTAFLSVLESLLLINLRMDGKLNYSAIVTLVKTILSATIALIAIKIYGYYGLYIAIPLGAIISIVLLAKSTMCGYVFKLEKTVIINLVITGLPLLINSFAWTVVTSIDKFVILHFFDVEALGYYSVALLAFSTIVVVPNTISQIMYIKMGENYGRDNSPIKLVEKTFNMTEWLAFSTGATVLISYHFLPIFVKIVMPQYYYGIEAAQVMMIGVAIYASSILYGNVFSVLKLNAVLIRTTIYLCIFNAAISSGLVLLNHDIYFVALGTALSYALYSFVLVYKLHTSTGVKMKKAIIVSWTPVIIATIPCLVSTILKLSMWLGLAISVFVYGIYAAVFLTKHNFASLK